jgi:hypothetical protein
MPFYRSVVLLPLLIATLHPAIGVGQQSAAGSARQASLHLLHPAAVSLVEAPELDDPAAASGTTVRLAVVRGTLPPRSSLTLRWRPEDLPAGVKGSEMVAVRLVGSDWLPEPAVTRGSDSVTVVVSASGVWAVHWRERESPCAGAGYHSLDFRLGRWSYVATGYTPGTSVVTASATHCALRDDYLDEKGGRSRTFFRYDLASATWFNTTIDPAGRSRSSGVVDSAGITFYSSPGDREQYLRAGDSVINYVAGQRSDTGAAWRVTATARYTRLVPKR